MTCMLKDRGANCSTLTMVVKMADIVESKERESLYKQYNPKTCCGKPSCNECMNILC